MKDVRRQAFVRHGESGFLSNPHAPWDPLPKRIVRTRLCTPEEGTLCTCPESRFELPIHGSDEHDLIAVDTHGPRVPAPDVRMLKV